MGCATLLLFSYTNLLFLLLLRHFMCNFKVVKYLKRSNEAQGIDINSLSTIDQIKLWTSILIKQTNKAWSDFFANYTPSSYVLGKFIFSAIPIDTFLMPILPFFFISPSFCSYFPPSYCFAKANICLCSSPTWKKRYSLRPKKNVNLASREVKHF